MIQGRPAVGKTTIAAQTPDPIFVMSPGETGLHTLIDSGQIPASIPNMEVSHWSNLMDILEELRTAKHGRKTLVLDVINGFEKLANTFVCERDYGGDMTTKGFMNYQVGYRTVAMGEWKLFLSAMDRLRTERKMMILMLAHTGVGNHKNPQGDDFNRWMPMFDGKAAWEQTFAWADAVLFADYEVHTTKKDDQPTTKAKGFGGSKRFLRVNWEAAFDAKNRYGWLDDIDMGSSGAEAWTNLSEALKLNNVKEGA